MRGGGMLVHWSCLWASSHRQNGVCDAALELQALCCAWLPDVLGLLALGQQTDCSIGQAVLDDKLQQYCYTEWGAGLSPQDCQPGTGLCFLLWLTFRCVGSTQHHDGMLGTAWQKQAACLMWTPAWVINLQQYCYSLHRLKL
jgi:hypothetical protein